MALFLYIWITKGRESMHYYRKITLTLRSMLHATSTKYELCSDVLYVLCFQVGREMLTPQGGNSDQGESPGFNLLMELLRGDHWLLPNKKETCVTSNFTRSSVFKNTTTDRPTPDEKFRYVQIFFFELNLILHRSFFIVVITKKLKYPVFPNDTLLVVF